MNVTTNFGTVKILMLKGEKGDKFRFEDFKPDELESLRGPQGEPFTFDDFTEQQLAELRADVASVYYRKEEATYHTTGTSTTTIEIPIASYTDHDMLFVDVEGLALTQGVDYTISGSSIVLAEPITHHWTAVNFRTLRAIAITADDYAALKGDKGDNGERGERGETGIVSDVTYDHVSLLSGTVADIKAAARDYILYPDGTAHERLVTGIAVKDYVEDYVGNQAAIISHDYPAEYVILQYGGSSYYLPKIVGGTGESHVNDGKIDQYWLDKADADTFGMVKVQSGADYLHITSGDTSNYLPLITGEAGNQKMAAAYLPLATRTVKGALSASDKLKIDLMIDAYESLYDDGDDNWYSVIRIDRPYYDSARDEEGVTTYYVPKLTSKTSTLLPRMLPVASANASGMITAEQYQQLNMMSYVTSTIAAGSTSETFAFTLNPNAPSSHRFLEVVACDGNFNPIDIDWSVSLVGSVYTCTVTLPAAQAGTTYITAMGNIVAYSGN